jgi:hypothetical protein
MIKKIQKELLLNYPILWNIRIVPVILALMGIHLLFFGIGYAATTVAFDKSHYYSFLSDDLAILYFVSVLVGILILIGWLVYYSRNNGFKTFYPCRTRQLYLEWLLIFVITTGITFIPYTLARGGIAKWRSVASLAEARDALDIINKAKVLIPNDYDNYFYNEELEKPIPVPENMKLDIEKLDLSLYSTEYSRKGGLIIKGYIGRSLLFYKEDTHYFKYYFSENPLEHMHRESFNETRLQESVKEWLREEKKDSIYAIMKDFDKLREKQKLKTGITPDQWLARVYNPPFFPVTESNHIVNNIDNCIDDWPDVSETTAASEPPYLITAVPVEEVFADSPHLENEDGSAISSSRYDNCLPYYELKSGYKQILICHEESYDMENLLLVCLCISLAMSVFIFSFRVTGGKFWLMALLSTGVLIFIVVLTGVGIGEMMHYHNEELIVMFMCLFWPVLFLGLLARILFKINEKCHKGKSSVYTNILVWLLPCLVPFSFFTHALFRDYMEMYYSPKENDIICMFWINIAFTAIAMWPISAVVRRWKSLPEE